MNMIKLFEGNCLDEIKKLDDQSIDAILTDPPYGLSSHSQEDVIECMTAWISGKEYISNKKGFMSKTWDSWTPGPEIWKECLRVLKPGGHLLCFAGTRTIDLMMIAIRLAGFEIRDTIGNAHGAPLMAWVYGQGMPKGLNISKAIDKKFGLKQKEIGIKVNTYDGSIRNPEKHVSPADSSNIGEWGLNSTPHGMPELEPNSDEAKQWHGWNTQLKPAWEPIIMARKPLDGDIVSNVLKHGTGGINVDASRIPVDMNVDSHLGGNGSWTTDKAGKKVYGLGFSGGIIKSSTEGRYPANVIHDGSSEVLETFRHVGVKSSGKPGKRNKKHESSAMGSLNSLEKEIGIGDSGYVDRFFYCSKATNAERAGSKHPTVKPLALLRYLLKLIVPENGIVLDPFAGTGTTGEAAYNIGVNAVLIEQNAEYIEDCKNRLLFCGLVDN